MILFLENDKPIRADLIHSMVLRSDLAPVPVTLEAEIRVDSESAKLFAEGKKIKSAQGDTLLIVKSVLVVSKVAQGQGTMDTVRIVALLDACCAVANAREARKAIYKEGASLAAIYKAAGASANVTKCESFIVPRFYCPVGETPSFHIAKILQESGGVVRWQSKSGLQFYTLKDLFSQKAKVTLPNDISDDISSGFMELHEIPRFFSIDPKDASFMLGNQLMNGSVQYSPFKKSSELRNMSRCLIQKKITKTMYAPHIEAGNIIEFIGNKPLCVITAAHVYESGADGANSNQYTRLWLGDLGE